METLLVISSVLLWLVLFGNLLLTMALIRRVNTPSKTPSIGLQAGVAAPDFAAETLTGDIVHLSTYLGGKVAFLFISSTCVPCRDIIPKVLALAPKVTHATAQFILISSSQMQETINFVKEFGIDLPVLIAPRSQSPIFDDYQAIAVPSYCIINEQGIVQASGPLGEEGWNPFVEAWGNVVESSPLPAIVKVGEKRMR